jgi:hypothetical protein
MIPGPESNPILASRNGIILPFLQRFIIFEFVAKIPDVKSNPAFYPYIQSTQYVEKGGRTTFHLLYGKTNDL